MDLATSKHEFVSHSNDGYEHVKTYDVVPSEVSLDIFMFRAKGEKDYARRLAAVDLVMVDYLRNRVFVDQRELIIGKELIRMEFRYNRTPS